MMPGKTVVVPLLLLACAAMACAQQAPEPNPQPQAPPTTPVQAPPTTPVSAPPPAGKASGADAKAVPAAAAAAGAGLHDDQTIQLAIKETLAEQNQIKQTRPDYVQTLRGNQYDHFAQAFSSAKVPDCLHPDALRLQPPHIGPVVLTQLLVLPFLALAKLNGKCL